MSLITLGEGVASSNVYGNIIDSNTYSNIITNKPGLPEWKWGDQECIQSVWFIDPSRPVTCGSVHGTPPGPPPDGSLWVRTKPKL